MKGLEFSKAEEQEEQEVIEEIEYIEPKPLNTPIGEFDRQYQRMVLSIIQNGYSSDFGNADVRAVYKDGSPAHYNSLLSLTYYFDNSELPISTSKRLAWKTAIKELLWIWQKKSNVVQVLRDMGVNIWNEWEGEDGTIGKAYGYQLGKKSREVLMYENKDVLVEEKGRKHKFEQIKVYQKLDQVDYLLKMLNENPTSRRHITSLWNVEELDQMNLEPCVYETQWHVKEGKLHLEVRSRSSDMALGNPFNVFQYNVLQRMFAQVLGLELGEYVFHIGDAHTYHRHEEELLKEIFYDAQYYEAPTLKINPEVKSFYDFKIEDFQLEDYYHGKKRKYEVAI